MLDFMSTREGCATFVAVGITGPGLARSNRRTLMMRLPWRISLDAHQVAVIRCVDAHRHVGPSWR